MTKEEFDETNWKADMEVAVVHTSAFGTRAIKEVVAVDFAEQLIAVKSRNQVPASMSNSTWIPCQHCELLNTQNEK